MRDGEEEKEMQADWWTETERGIEQDKNIMAALIYNVFIYICGKMELFFYKILSWY